MSPLESTAAPTHERPLVPTATASESPATSGLPDVVLDWVDRILGVELNDALQGDPESEVYAAALQGDPIKKARTLVTACRASIQRREALRQAIHAVNHDHPETPLRVVTLVKDVDTRWSATFLMVDRLLELYPVCLMTLHSCQ